MYGILCCVGNLAIYLSLSSKPVGVNCVAIDFSRLITFTVVLSSPNHQPSLRVRAFDRHRWAYHFWFPRRDFGVGMKQRS